VIHDSPLPDVEIPDLPLTEYVLAGGVGQPGKPALIDAASGRVMTMEAILLRHPDVVDAAVVGLPDDEAGEIPKSAAGKILRRVLRDSAGT
jgi:hypothetical protein